MVRIFMKGRDSLAPTILFQIQSVLRADEIQNIEYPTIAQLAERPTVDVYVAIGRSLVRIRVVGCFFSLINFSHQLLQTTLT
jgi:hypothetical protein